MRIKILFLSVFLLFLFSFFSLLPLLLAQCESEDPLCGPKSLLVVCKKLGVETNLKELKQLSDYEEGKGTTMAGLYKAAQTKGLYAEGVKLSLDELAKLKIPIVVYLWGNHFVAIDKFEKDKLRIIDSHYEEPLLLSKEDFAKIYSGFALLISKGKSSFPKFKTKGSDIRFEEYVYNFGLVDQWAKIDHIFKFRNAGNKELIISHVRACCGASATLLSGKTIPPQGEGELKATIDIGGRNGAHDFSVDVYSNDSVTPIVPLQIKGTIKTGFLLSPRNINWNSFKKGTLATKKIYINRVDENFKILKVDTSSDYLSTKINEISETQNGYHKRFEVEVVLAPAVPVGKLEEKLTIYTTSEKYPKIEIPVTGNIKGDIEFHPDTFFFGVANKGDTPSCKVTILTTGEEPLKIEKIDPEPLPDKDLQAGEQARFRETNPLGDYISVAITPKTEGKEYELTATLKDNAPVGTIKGNITVYTNNPDQPQIEVPVYALIRE